MNPNFSNNLKNQMNPSTSIPPPNLAFIPPPPTTYNNYQYMQQFNPPPFMPAYNPQFQRPPAFQQQQQSYQFENSQSFSMQQPNFMNRPPHDFTSIQNPSQSSNPLNPINKEKLSNRQLDSRYRRDNNYSRSIDKCKQDNNKKSDSRRTRDSNISPLRNRNRSRSRSRRRSKSRRRSRSRRTSRSRRRSRTRSHSRRRNSRYKGESRIDRRNDTKKYEQRDNCSRRQKDDEKSLGKSPKENNVVPSEPVIKYVQTTLIPVFYAKDENNPKIVKALPKLTDLCQEFEETILTRSLAARKAMNLPLESTKVPDYHQLLMTKKFSKFHTQCTCDHSERENIEKCGKHRTKKSLVSSSDSSSSSSSDDSIDLTSSSESGSSSSSSDSDSSLDSKTSRNSSKKANKEKTEEFDDIKSMEINRKLKHPERLHKELCFNEPDQTNDGPLCKCKLKNRTFGIRHQIYFGEEVVVKCFFKAFQPHSKPTRPIEACNLSTNNSDKLHHYRITISPSANFMVKQPTKIQYDNHDYIFEGFSLFSHEPIENTPDCEVVIYNQDYKLNIVREDFIENFTIREIELIKKYILKELLELYDIKWKGYNAPKESCNRFHVMPRFCRSLPYDGKEILSPCEIIKYFLMNESLVVDEMMLEKCVSMSDRVWLDYIEDMQGSIVTCPGKRPASIRLDQLDRDHIKRGSDGEKNTLYPLIIHFSSGKVSHGRRIMKSIKYKRLFKKYFKLRHLINNKTKPTSEDKAKLRALSDQLENQLKKASEQKEKEIMIELTSENFHKTGIRTDLVQHAVLIPTLVEHLRFHLSLKFLENKIGYHFKNRLLLQHALTHPSGAYLLHQNLGTNPDHIKNVLFNCRIRNPIYGQMTAQRRKSILRKKGIHMLFSIMSRRANDNEETSWVSNYERLEFMGDKILELLVSKHLYALFPSYDEGQLSEYRNAIVRNQYLAVLARKLDMHSFITFYHGVDLCSNSALNHALANSFEALLAAIYLDSDLETCSDVLAKTLWYYEDTMDLYSTWTQLPLHPIQAQMPNGDRHLIAKTKILQHVSLFEDMIGVEFNHIRLLAQAFCTRSASFNLITLGDNQRLEFLGDTVLNYVVSDYLYRFFPNHHEGHLSLLRSSLVCNSTQALLHDELGMGDFVLTSYINNRHEPQGNLKRKADVFEAFVGALYLDQGLESVKTFCCVTMFNKLQDIIMYQFWNDPKSRLQQCCLSLRDVDDLRPSLPTYKCIEEKGPPNHKTYRVAVYFKRNRIGEGSGKSIHDAEVEAAKMALNTQSKMFPILNKYVSNDWSFSKFRDGNSLKANSVQV